jgi:hypothetical protein
MLAKFKAEKDKKAPERRALLMNSLNPAGLYVGR